ncbi:MAG: hypothetical protein ACXU9K_11220 [Thermodesulfobacteriota bacterium]
MSTITPITPITPLPPSLRFLRFSDSPITITPTTPTTPHPPIGNFDQEVQKVIFNAEKLDPEPTCNKADNTVTYGYGYTFIRKGDIWRIYGNLDTDLAAIGITLNGSWGHWGPLGSGLKK